MEYKNIWCYRVDASKVKYFTDELYEGRLRQGWGWNEKQDLRNFEMDEGAGRNRTMFKRVKKGDILLVPRMPSWGEVAIVEATEDWNTGYRFEIDNNQGDYGHIFPAKLLKRFTRFNANVSGRLRATLKNPSRFWNINQYAEDVELLLNADVSELSKKQDHKSRLESSIGSVFNEIFNENEFADKLYDKLTKDFTSEEWEFALIYGLQEIFPFYQIDRVGGKEEVNHGADILIRLPSILLNYEYAIAIQVKDYDGFVATKVIDQINKSDKYWDTKNIKLIDKIVIITKAKEDKNLHLLENNSGVNFIFADDLKQLLSEIGKKFIGVK